MYYAKARGYQSALAAALFHDNVPAAVYENLIASVCIRHLPALYRYFDLRRRKMKLPDIHHYDTYVPILSEIESAHLGSGREAGDRSRSNRWEANTAERSTKGLNNGWCDRYPNQGKQSGAFSSRHVRRRSVHPDELSERSARPRVHARARSRPLDAQLLFGQAPAVSVLQLHDLRGRSGQHVQRAIALPAPDAARPSSDKERAFLVNREIDAIRGTIIRQTMFAEFEKITHESVEAGEPLTVDKFKEIYRELLNHYFGPDFALDEELALECFRIPHFYRAFYVYKYATGLSAAIALSQRVIEGGQHELADYLGFLKGGCSKFPLDLLRDAGVDMEKPEPVDTAHGPFQPVGRRT